MRVAVLGANGFIGSRTVEMLHLGGAADVVPVVRDVARLALTARFALPWALADARDRGALASAFAGCDVVVHAVAGDRDTVLGTLAPVYEAAAAAGVRRLVYLSSASVHGQAPAPGTDERSPLQDRQPLPYNAWKIRAEQTLRELRARGRVELVLLRPGIVYGPRARWTGGFADALLAGHAYVVDGAAGVFNGIYVDNLVHAIRLAATARDADGEALLVGDDEHVTWADFYRPLAAALGFDLDAVPSVPAATGAADWWDRLTAARASTAGRTVLGFFPMRLRRAAYAAAEAWHAAGGVPGDGPAGAAPPAASLEMTLLQTCRWKLPSTKAAALLDYRPTVAFDEACRRSVAWLAFAGYPVHVGEAASHGR
jgi:nucleoside-diphosphate-sugar epimerase